MTNGYKNKDKVINDAKEKYFTDLGAKLADPSTGQRIY